MSDFVLQGSVRRTITAYADYNYLMTRASPFETEVFLGTSLRLLQFPRVTSPDGLSIETDSVTVVNPGLDVTVQKQFDLHITLYTKLNLDVPVKSSEDMDFNFDQTNVTVRSGLLYGLFWPIGFAGKIQYHLDRAKTKNGATDVEVKMAEWSVGANLLYAF